MARKKYQNVQIITKEGEPEWAVISYKDYIRLSELENISKDAKAFKKALSAGKEELTPGECAHR